MKKIIFLLGVLSCLNAGAQAYGSGDNPHEVKLNIGLFLATSTIETSYEYFFAEDISIGGTIYFDNDATDFNGTFGIGPNFRAYFGFAPRSGFFAEAFGLYYKGKENIQESELVNREVTFNTTALGIGTGYKWVTRSERFTIEANVGLGRNINTADFQNAFMFKGGLSLGYRF